MTDTPEIARIRAAVKNFDGYYGPSAFSAREMHDSCTSDAMTAVLAHIDAQAAALYALGGVIAACRDALPVPAPGSAAEAYWAGAMCAPEHVPDYVKAAFDAQATEIELLRVDAMRYRAMRKIAHEDSALFRSENDLDRDVDAAMKEKT